MNIAELAAFIVSDGEIICFLQSASLSLPEHLAVEPSRGPLFPGFALVTGPSRVADLVGG
jgi:hypothetical protein